MHRAEGLQQGRKERVGGQEKGVSGRGSVK